MIERDFFINTVRLVDIEGATNIPTVLYYQKDGPPLFGHLALSEEKARFLINEDFKIDLGNIDPTSTKPKEKFITASGEKKSAIQLSSDFMNVVFGYTKEWFQDNNVSQPKNIIIAEPLSLQSDLASPEWLTFYRNNIKRILSGQRYGFESISFLPEPFAVFQYYRYGHKHPILSQRAKHNALVIDFGGGTFDVCIIETTKEGDIRIGGKHSRPLAASSVAIGGFYINRKIAEHLIQKYSTTSIPNKKFKSAIKTYWDWRKDYIDWEVIAPNVKEFIKNFHSLVREVENAKITLCKLINNWDLNCRLSESVPISIRSDPFDSNSEVVNGLIKATELQNIFINNVWKPHLQPNIRRTLSRGKSEIQQGKVSVALLSGGSANIGWLRNLIKENFDEDLTNVEIFPLPNFQEVVSQGLSLECARRYFTEDKKGDFSNITYNRICLIMNPDGYGYNTRPFKNKSPNLPQVNDMPGVLLPSASILHKLIDKPIKWKVKLPRRPSKKLEYRFLRSSLDPDDTENILNIVNYVAYTPPNAKFDAEIQIELTVKENGTAYPKFIYKTGPYDSVIDYVEGIPFPIDLTYSQESVPSGYIGFDFGTSNSSISFVDDSAIQVYSKRSKDEGFRELNDLVELLPFPLARHLATYLSQTDNEKLVNEAREFVEISFALASYISYLEYCSCEKNITSKIFKGLTQRSAGPLWYFLTQCIEKMPASAYISKNFKEFLTDENSDILDTLVTELTKHKHGKISASEINTVRPIQIIANISYKVFSEIYFGYFEQVQKQKFSKEYTGRFWKAHGRSPFINAFQYSGSYPFSDDEPVLLDYKEGKVMPLQPLIFWDVCTKHSDVYEGHCFFYDKYEKKSNSYSYKAAGYKCTCNVSEKNQYREIAKQLNALNQIDCAIEIIKVGSFSKISLS